MRLKMFGVANIIVGLIMWCGIFYLVVKIPWDTVDKWLTEIPDRTEVIIYVLAAVFIAWRRNI